MYLTYEEYKNKYDGLLEETDYKKLERTARKYIDAYTFNRIRDLETIPEDVKDCIFELVDYLQELIATGGKEIQSETTDTYTLTYATPSKSSIGDAKMYNITNIIRTCLMHTNLLYRGV